MGFFGAIKSGLRKTFRAVKKFQPGKFLVKAGSVAAAIGASATGIAGAIGTGAAIVAAIKKEAKERGVPPQQVAAERGEQAVLLLQASEKEKRNRTLIVAGAGLVALVVIAFAIRR